MPEKKILYIDMDGVIADFDGAIKKHCPDLETSDAFPDYESRRIKVDAICESNPEIFHDMEAMPDAIESVKVLFNYYDIYFLSTPMWNVPLSFTGKRIWLDKHFGEDATKRLILTHRKDLNIGHILIDDRLRNGVDQFKGFHIHFGQQNFKDWFEVTLFLMRYL